MDAETRSSGRAWGLWMLLLGTTALGAWSEHSSVQDQSQWVVRAPAWTPRDNRAAAPRIVFPAHEDSRGWDDPTLRDE